uniref:ATP-dependent RNA helicase n=1 Tax=Ditylenchus dipsaci TaxID=166011 RepID=A0A915D862_9BILA
MSVLDFFLTSLNSNKVKNIGLLLIGNAGWPHPVINTDIRLYQSYALAAVKLLPGLRFLDTASVVARPEIEVEDEVEFNFFSVEVEDEVEFTVELRMRLRLSGANIEHTAIVESWKDVGFQPKLFFNIVERAKYIRPRKIQAMTIPFIMDGRDVKGHAETGSGKTAAFLLPIINQIMKSGAAENSEFGKPSPHAIIVEPTRELCLQVYEQGLKFASDTGVFVTRSYGQFNMRQNMEELQVGCDILCATPVD